MKNKGLLMKIFFLGIFAYFFIDFIKHARIIVIYPMRMSIIYVIIIIGILFYSFYQIRKKS
ncbi:hypothetical protein ACTQ5K_21655 [Niallia sp. Sow4_A1]|uniref:Uncharacterized protein n=1 Tax=Niallia hominis TaxID=3133173 RepID=A0ABV1F2B7_9BACI|nr:MULTISPECIES: hypothetical protein [Bacillaceae]MCM3363831.1 hypothetical protein [Niallia sp. MER TA 168]